MKRALTGAILIHAAAIVFAAYVIKAPSIHPDIALVGVVILGSLGLIALIAAAIKKDVDPKV